MANVFKNFVYQFVHYTKQLCRYITRHRGVFLTALQTVITDPTDYAKVVAMVDAIILGCGVLDKYYPNIPA